MSAQDESDRRSKLSVLSGPTKTFIDQSNPSATRLRAIRDFFSKTWAVPLIFLGLGCVFGVVPVLNAYLYGEKNRDYAIWYEIGRTVTAGEPLYERQTKGEPKYMYPPTAAVLLYAPLSTLGTVGFAA